MKIVSLEMGKSLLINMIWCKCILLYTFLLLEDVFNTWVKVFRIMPEFRICDGRRGRFSKSRKSVEKIWGGGGNLMLQQNSIDYGLTVWNLKFLNIAMTILKDQS